MKQNQKPRANSLPTKHVDKQDFFDDEYDDTWPMRLSSSARRYRSDVKGGQSSIEADVDVAGMQRDYITQTGQRRAIPARRTAPQAHVPLAPTYRRRPVTTEDRGSSGESAVLQEYGGSVQVHWLVYVGVALLIMLTGWVLLSMLMNWWQITQDDWHYGRPRTFQSDAVVGHGDSPDNPTHFIALNLRRHVQIIEMPGGDATKAKVYVGPILLGQGQDLAAVTLSFKDIHHDGKPVMIVSVQDSRFVYLNENGTFRPARPGESVLV